MFRLLVEQKLRMTIFQKEKISKKQCRFATKWICEIPVEHQILETVEKKGGLF